ncbi:dynamin family protein [Nocardia tenerifensis]|uniref:dynamin family protein n=1 Tax=Nocardia tenerifensis TaxID=228006 RepID=UPI0002F25099|nr:dynamin family protein [Nocardia tenerifensis]
MIDEVRDTLVREADKLIALADEPITVGMVGTYSAGKSLLLGLLLGAPDLLPVSDDPTTANVTVLQLRQGREGDPTLITRAALQYLSHDEVSACVATMLDELTSRCASAGMIPETLAALHRMRGLPTADFWREFGSWARTNAWPTRSPSIRLAVRELLRVGGAVLTAPWALGWSKPIGADVFRAALSLPAPVADPTVFPDWFRGTIRDRRQTGEVDASSLRATLPLIRRVVLDIAVPTHIWDLTALCGHNALALLDFPGLGADVSEIRDRGLARRELADVTTIFVLLHGQRVSDAAAMTILDMLDRAPEDIHDSVLVGIGRFDQLPHSISSDLATGPSARLSDSQLTGGVLAAVLSSARQLLGSDRDERIHFHSAMLGIAALDRRFADRGRYSPEFAAERSLAEHIPRALDNGASWSRIVGRLVVDDPGSVLAPALTAYADDGGVRRIRDGVERHVQTHGLRIRRAQLLRQADRLETTQQRLIDALRLHGPRENDETRAQRDVVESLVESVRNSLAHLADRSTLELADPRTVRVNGQAGLTDSVRQLIVGEIFGWPEWSALFAAVRDGVVCARLGDELIFDQEDEEDQPSRLPLSTREFEARFTEAVTLGERFARDRAWTLLAEWARRADVERSALHHRRAEIITPAVQQRLCAQFAGRGYPRYLDRALNLEWLPDTTRKNVEQRMARRAEAGRNDENAADTDDPVGKFPLRRNAGFAWDPGMPEAVRASVVTAVAGHQIRPARLRRELVNGAVDLVISRISAEQAEIAWVVAELLRRSRARLDAPELFVATVIGIEDDHPTDPAADLAAVRHPARGGGG